MSIRALIVDDEPLARTGVQQLVEPLDDVTVVGEAPRPFARSTSRRPTWSFSTCKCRR
jgi:DNA-binding NarL/FixJ family response regulator